MKISPGKLLQTHGIEISPCEPRTTEEVAQDYIDRGIIKLIVDSTAETPESEV